MPSLKEVIISITNRCNISCKMCDIACEKSEELPAEQWKKVIEDVNKIGASSVVFSGGEPLLRKDIFGLISFVKDTGLTACITSNGLLINSEVANRLSQSGVDVVNISVEGPEKIHDYLRGKGSYKKAISALSNLKRYGVESTIATVVSRYNYKYLEHIVKIADQLGATTIKFQPFNSLFLRDKSREKEFFLSKKDAVELSHVIDKAESFSLKRGITMNPSSYLKRMPLYLSRGLIGGNGASCGAIWTSCPINSEGEIYPCWVLSEKDRLIGNITESSLLEIWDSEYHDLLRDKIKNEGCPGCMMSCYDGIFGDDSIKRKMDLKIGRMKKEGVLAYATKALKRLRKKLIFYRSYRGGAKGIANKAKNLLKKKPPSHNSVDKEKIKEAILKIEELKQLFK